MRLFSLGRNAGATKAYFVDLEIFACIELGNFFHDCTEINAPSLDLMYNFNATISNVHKIALHCLTALRVERRLTCFPRRMVQGLIRASGVTQEVEEPVKNSVDPA